MVPGSSGGDGNNDGKSAGDPAIPGKGNSENEAARDAPGGGGIGQSNVIARGPEDDSYRQRWLKYG